jgi:glyoxylase-like metal-dependent hydrolase (beta-lactamase superfamily II)
VVRRRVVFRRIGGGFEITFHGVRGSTPCHGDSTARYGGNTSCVSVAVPGHDPVVFDLGTGLRYFGAGLPSEPVFRGTCLLSHLHWDHVQGLPFFTPLLRHGAHLDVFAPVQDDGSSPGDALYASIGPPLFPIGLHALPGNVAG